MAITLPADVLDYSTLTFTEGENATQSNCTSPAGHCFGSDGGTGIPTNLKVAEGRGGGFETWKLNANKSKILNKYKVERCQYCQKFYISKDITNETQPEV